MGPFCPHCGEDLKGQGLIEPADDEEVDMEPFEDDEDPED